MINPGAWAIIGITGLPGHIGIFGKVKHKSQCGPHLLAELLEH